jgi:hypothetical protein
MVEKRLYEVFYLGGSDPRGEDHGVQGEPKNEPWWWFGQEVEAEYAEDAIKIVAEREDLQGTFIVFETDALTMMPAVKRVTEVWDIG